MYHTATLRFKVGFRQTRVVAKITGFKNRTDYKQCTVDIKSTLLYIIQCIDVGVLTLTVAGWKLPTFLLYIGNMHIGPGRAFRSNNGLTRRHDRERIAYSDEFRVQQCFADSKPCDK